MMGEGTVNDEELVEVIERALSARLIGNTSDAEAVLAALRSAGFQVFKPEDCEVMDYMAGTYFLVPDNGPADSGGSG